MSVRMALVRVFVALTVTPGSADPVPSLTVPSTRAVVCAVASTAQKRSRYSTKRIDSDLPRGPVDMFPHLRYSESWPVVYEEGSITPVSEAAIHRCCAAAA